MEMPIPILVVDDERDMPDLIQMKFRLRIEEDGQRGPRFVQIAEINLTRRCECQQVIPVSIHI